MRIWNEYKRNLNEAKFSHADGTEVDPKTVKSLKSLTSNWGKYNDKLFSNNDILKKGKEPKDSDYDKQDTLHDLVVKQYNSLVKKKVINGKIAKEVYEIESILDNLSEFYK